MRSAVTVEPNPVQGTMYIDADGGASIKVSQKFYEREKKGVLIETRVTLLHDNLSRVLSLGLKAGDRLGGKIVLTRKDGDIWSYYSESPDDIDDID